MKQTEVFKHKAFCKLSLNCYIVYYLSEEFSYLLADVNVMFHFIRYFKLPLVKRDRSLCTCVLKSSKVTRFPVVPDEKCLVVGGLLYIGGD